jgi:hypothetical protein
LYYVARNELEVNINDYNPTILMAWKGNMDIQLCIGGYKFTIDYISSYLSKVQWLSNSLLEDNKHKLVQPKRTQKLGVDMLKRRTIPATEMADKLLQHSLYKFDADHMFINTNEDSQRKRTLCTKNQLYIHEDNKSAVLPNFADTFYPNRPKKFEQTCYMNFVMTFKMVKILLLKVIK